MRGEERSVMEGISALSNAHRSSTRKTICRFIERKNVPNLAQDGDLQYSDTEIMVIECLFFAHFCFTLFVLGWETQDIWVNVMGTQLESNFKVNSREIFLFRIQLSLGIVT